MLNTIFERFTLVLNVCIQGNTPSDARTSFVRIFQTLINVLDTERFSKNVNLTCQSDLMWIYAASQLLISMDLQQHTKFKAVDFLEKISERTKYSKFKVDETKIVKVLARVIERHRSDVKISIFPIFAYFVLC